MTSTVSLTGNTYRVRDLIKGRGGKWNAASKSWTMDAVAWETLSAQRITPGVVANGAGPVASSQRAIGVTTPCPHCHSYCFGDCQS